MILNETTLPNLHPPSSRRFGVMLCYPFEPGRITKWSTPYVLMQPKLNGHRCRAILRPNGVAHLFTSEGNTILHLPHILERLSQIQVDEPTELDCELYKHGLTLQEIDSIVSRTKNLHPLHEQVELHVFDLISTKPQAERLFDMLELLAIKNDLSSPVLFVKTQAADTLPEINQLFEAYLDEGYEGMVVRNPKGLYKRKRSSDIMKFKPHQSDSYEVVGWEEEVSIEGQPKGRLGALVLSSSDGDTFNCGSGFSAKQREHYWSIRDELPGSLCTIKYQALTPGRKVPFHSVFKSIISGIGGEGEE